MATIQERVSVKQAATTYPVHDLIRSRWSPRAFADKPIAEEDMFTLFEAASWAASSYNEQPWRYIYAHREDEKAFQRLLSCINPGNQQWAQHASVLVLNLAQKHFMRNGRTNRHYLHDAGAANTTFMLQAASMDIYGHMMAGFDYEKTVQTFELSEEIDPVCFIALGYLGEDISSLDEAKQQSEQKARSRKPVSELITKL